MWIVYILLSAFFLSFFDLFRKKAIAGNPIFPVLAWSNLATLLFVIIFFAVQGKFESMIQISRCDFWLIAIKACIVLAEWACTFYAFQALPLSTCVPVYATAPLWTFIGAIICYRETPTRIQLVGMLVLFAGYWLFAMAGRKEGTNIFRSKGILFCLLGVIAGATSSVYDKFLLNPNHRAIAIDAFQFYCMFTIAILTFLVRGGIWIYAKRAAKSGKGKGNEKLRWNWSMLAVGAVLVISDYLYFLSVSTPETLISIVTLLRRLNVVFAFVWGIVFFREGNAKSKAVALAAILFGAVLLGL